MQFDDVDIAIVGAGIAGIATAYFLAASGRRKIALIEPGQPMGHTSAKSGENYRNWWPHRVMTEFTDRSIELMESIARGTGNRINLTRRGYALATRRAHPQDLIDQLQQSYGARDASLVRIHETATSTSYQPARSADWMIAPDGVDVLLDRELIRRSFPSFATDIAAVLHVRRAGDLDSQQMGQYMLERIRAAGGHLVRGRVLAIERSGRFVLRIEHAAGPAQLRAEIVVNAAGPDINAVAALLGEALPVTNVLQQKIAFEDREGAIGRTMPFAIDLDGQTIDWTEEERAALADDPALAPLTGPMPGGIHCRPEGGEGGRWVKLGWAYNHAPETSAEPPRLNPHFPEIVLRGASRLNPSLKRYYGRLPRPVHYGGYYTMTRENWPLIGPMPGKGAFVVGALSGYGTMAACAAGELCAAWIDGAALPGYARRFSPERHSDTALTDELIELESKGVL